MNINAAEVSITIDDFNIDDFFYMSPKERNKKFFETFNRHAIKTTLFVQGKYVDSLKGQKLLKEWDMQGHQISNHTYSHMSYSSEKISYEEFVKDILNAESLLKNFKNFKKFLRFPYLHEGDSQTKIQEMRNFLKTHDYQNGAVTIDASDWYIDRRLKEKMLKNQNIDLKPYRDYYLAHIWNRAQFYNDLSKKVVGREVKHTLLLHYNLLNALFVEDLIAMFKSKGWTVISSEEAFQDPVFNMYPKIVPLNNSLIWQLAKEAGKFDSILRDPGEDGEYEKESMDHLDL